MESLSIWSLAGVVLNSAVIMAVRLSTQRVWNTFNYDVTVSNGVNLSHPLLYNHALRAHNISPEHGRLSVARSIHAMILYVVY